MPMMIYLYMEVKVVGSHGAGVGRGGERPNAWFDNRIARGFYNRISFSVCRSRFQEPADASWRRDRSAIATPSRHHRGMMAARNAASRPRSALPILHFMTTVLADIRKAAREIGALRSSSGLLGRAQETFMPTKGGAVRAESQAVLSTLVHAKLTSEEYWGLLTRASGLSLNPREAAEVRELKRDAENARKIPADLAG